MAIVLTEVVCVESDVCCVVSLECAVVSEWVNVDCGSASVVSEGLSVD